MNLGGYYSAPSTPMSQTRRLRHPVVKLYSEWDQHWDLGRPVTKSHCQTLPHPICQPLLLGHSIPLCLETMTLDGRK